MALISNNPGFRQEHTGVPHGSDSYDRISYMLREKYMLSIPHASGWIGKLHSSLCVQNMVMYTHHLNNMCVTLFTGASVILQLFTQCLVKFIPFSGQVPHFASPLLIVIGCRTLPR